MSKFIDPARRESAPSDPDAPGQKQAQVPPRHPDFPVPHPGEFLREEVMEPEELSVAELAAKLGVERQTLNNLVKPENPSSISPNMARRLQLCTGISATLWLGMQADFDLWKERQRRPDADLGVKPLASTRA